LKAAVIGRSELLSRRLSRRTSRVSRPVRDSFTAFQGARDSTTPDVLAFNSSGG
jgi:hypothetical protein